MEGIKRKCTTICLFGARKNIGASTAGINLASELVNRNFSVLYGNSFESNKNLTFLLKDNHFKDRKEDKEIYFQPTKIERLNLLAFSKDASRMSPQKIEEMLIDLPETVSKNSDFFIFNINDPFNFPDRYVLLHSDINIIVARVEATVFSDIFQLFEKLAFLPVKPSKIYLIFNNMRDIDRAFETYLELMKQSEELNLKIKFYFLGLLPWDLLRQNFSNQLRLPIRLAFPDSSFKGAISFIADKIISLTKPETADETDEGQLLLEESGGN